MNLDNFSTKDIGNLGERVGGEYLRRLGFTGICRNIRSSFGEIDIVATSRDGACLHIIEVKTRLCMEFPGRRFEAAYDPSDNLHAHKIRRVARLASWYVGLTDWEGEWQIDGLTVWLRKRDGMARVRYYPQLL